MCVLLVIMSIRVWVWAYAQRSAMRVLLAGLASWALQSAIISIRIESGIIIIVIAVIGVVGMLAKIGGSAAMALVVAALVTILVVYEVVYVRIMGTADLLVFYRESYQAGAGEQSLGDRFIVGAKAPIRAVLGFVYLHVFPIPFWHGLTTLNSYYWFKSAQVPYMIALLPAAIAGANRIWRDTPAQRIYALFFCSVYIIITTAVALSSLETRHSAQVLPFLMLLGATEHDTALSTRLRSGLIIGLASVYVVWVIIKFL